MKKRFQSGKGTNRILCGVASQRLYLIITCKSPFGRLAGTEGWFWDVSPAIPDPIVYCNYALIGDSTGFDSTDYRIAEGNLNAPQFPDETQWMGERILFERLAGHPELAEGDVIMEAFYENKENEAVGQLTDIALASDRLSGTPDSLLQVYEAEKVALMEMLRLNDSLISVTSSDSTIWFTSDSLRLLVQSVQQLMYQREYQMIQQQNGSLALLETQNTAIPAMLMAEVNERKINEIYFATIAREIYTFTPTQLADIISIANQCPLTGGMSVYKARSLYAMVNDEADYDDTGVCNALGMSMRKPQTEEVISKKAPIIYPNPANRELNVYCPDIEEEETLLSVYDLTGKRLMSVPLTQSNQKIVLDRITKGIYLVQIISQGNLLLNEKLIVE